jgi:hypothetical protein
VNTRCFASVTVALELLGTTRLQRDGCDRLAAVERGIGEANSVQIATEKGIGIKSISNARPPMGKQFRAAIAQQRACLRIGQRSESLVKDIVFVAFRLRLADAQAG